MKKLKSLFSLILGVLTLFTCTQSAFADGDNFDLLVIGSKKSMIQLSKNLVEDLEELPEIVSIINDGYEYKRGLKYKCKKTGTSFMFEYGELNKKNRIKFNSTVINSRPIILALVDIEQDIEKVKEDIQHTIDYICDVKDDYTQIIIVGCCENLGNENECEDYLNELANYVCYIEKKGAWGSVTKKTFGCQFLNFSPCKKDSILKVVEDKYETFPFKKKTLSMCVLV